MAVVTIVITDEPGGTLRIKGDFDPPIQRDRADEATAAQRVGSHVVAFAMDLLDQLGEQISSTVTSDAVSN